MRGRRRVAATATTLAGSVSLLLIGCRSAATGGGCGDDPLARWEATLAAERDGELERYHRCAAAGRTLSPEDPSWVYHAARAAALRRRDGEALGALDALARVGAGVDPAADTAFAAISRTERFLAARDRLLRLSEPLVQSDTALVLVVPGLVPENLAHDAATGDFLVGDLLGRRILRAGRDGSVSEFIGTDDSIGAVLGMKVDTARGILWVNAFDRPAGRGADRSARSTLFALDLRSGALRARYVPPDGARGSHLFNDLVVAPDGDVFLTDSESAAVYRLPVGDTALVRWYDAAHDGLAYPNGLALDADRGTLYVAHVAGIAAIDLATGRSRPLRATEGTFVGGIDGLYRLGDALVGIQNGGLALDRVLSLRIGPDGRIDATKTLERRHPAFSTPTTGVLVGDTLFYIANSQIPRLSTPGKLREGVTLDPIVVLRLVVSTTPAGGDNGPGRLP